MSKRSSNILTVDGVIKHRFGHSFFFFIKSQEEKKCHSSLAAYITIDYATIVNTKFHLLKVSHSMILHMEVVKSIPNRKQTLQY